MNEPEWGGDFGDVTSDGSGNVWINLGPVEEYIAIPRCLPTFATIQYVMKDIPAKYQKVWLGDEDEAPPVIYFEEN